MMLKMYTKQFSKLFDSFCGWLVGIGPDGQ